MIVDAYDRLQDKTPIDSGEMSANWRVGIAHVNDSYDFELRKGDIATAKARARVLAKRAEPGDVVFISNAAPYAQDGGPKEPRWCCPVRLRR